MYAHLKNYIIILVFFTPASQNTMYIPAVLEMHPPILVSLTYVSCASYIPAVLEMHPPIPVSLIYVSCASYIPAVLEMHPPIPVAGFVNRMHMMRANDNQLFVEEFNSIEMNPQHPTNAALLPENNDKNRSEHYHNYITGVDRCRGIDNNYVRAIITYVHTYMTVCLYIRA